MSPITSGALLGDRLRVDFNVLDEAVYYRSLAISGEDYHALPEIIELIGGACAGDDAFDLVFVETVGAGQNETKIRQHVDKTLVVLTPGMGDAVQMDKAGILEIADVFVCNKADQQTFHRFSRGRCNFSSSARKSPASTPLSSGTGLAASRTIRSTGGSCGRARRNCSRITRLTRLRSTARLSSFLPTTSPRRASLKP